MSKALAITLVLGTVVGAALFIYVYRTGGLARFCATPIGPCTEGKK